MTKEQAPATARRFAELTSAAAGSEARLNELEDALREAEHYRQVAEQQLWNIENYDTAIGRVFTAADDPAIWDEPAMPSALLDLASGEVWKRTGDGANWQKQNGEQYGGEVEHWPLPGGPFIGFEETWNLDYLLRRSQERSRMENDIRVVLRDKDGYYETSEDGKKKHAPFTPDAVPAALVRVLDGYRTKAFNAELKRRVTEDTLAEQQKKWEEASPDVIALRDTAGAVLAALNKDPGSWRVTVHELVKRAEHQLLQDVNVPEEGDDYGYQKSNLIMAAATLVVAAARTDNERPNPA